MTIHTFEHEPTLLTPQELLLSRLPGLLSLWEHDHDLGTHTNGTAKDLIATWSGLQRLVLPNDPDEALDRADAVIHNDTALFLEAILSHKFDCKSWLFGMEKLDISWDLGHEEAEELEWRTREAFDALDWTELFAWFVAARVPSEARIQAWLESVREKCEGAERFLAERPDLFLCLATDLAAVIAASRPGLEGTDPLLGETLGKHRRIEEARDQVELTLSCDAVLARIPRGAGGLAGKASTSLLPESAQSIPDRLTWSRERRSDTNSVPVRIDWSRVTVEHIQQACKLYDSKAAVPKRPAKNTFLLLNKKTYPAKFIRGLAYCLATGIELDPSKDYAGGLDTVRFFEALGLPTQREQASADELPVVSTVLRSSGDGQPAKLTREHREPQKRALAELLRHRYGTIEMEAQFPWLTVPRPDQMDESISTMFHALKTMRGYSEFITPGKSLKCDFFVPSERLIVEYDERQHFTLQRAKTLELYPPDLSLGFDREEWITACRTIKATDPTPPYRDEQRAFYDSLRDILAARNGVRLIRLRYGKQDWTVPGAFEVFSSLFSATNIPVVSPTQRSTWQAESPPADNKIMRIALISHNYKVADSHGLYDYSEYFSRINECCDQQGCDTILYALYTWDENSAVPRTHDALFSGLANVQRIILEVGRPPESFDHVEAWERNRKEPLVASQCFAISAAPRFHKEAFLKDLPQRQVQDAVLLLCGESNIVSLIRGSDEIDDPYGFAQRLGELRARLILNPLHDYMRRYEMREKRRYYSLGGRTVISVWNQGKGRESRLPWTVFHNGQEQTNAVRELASPFPDRPDIRIGILDVLSIQQ